MRLVICYTIEVSTATFADEIFAINTVINLWIVALLENKLVYSRKQQRFNP